MEEKIKVDISFSAMEMLEEIYAYKSEYSKKSADTYIDGLLNSIQKLKIHPESCAPCKNSKLKNLGYRCCLFKDHIIIYESEEKLVRVLAIIHSKRNPDSIDI